MLDYDIAIDDSTIGVFFKFLLINRRSCYTAILESLSCG